MPLFETQVTAGTACISTAADFIGSGAPKKWDPSWWTLFRPTPHAASVACGGWLQTALWLAWLAGMLSLPTVFYPTPDAFPSLLGASCAGMAVAVFLPDDGSTVLPYYVHLVIPGIVFRSFFAGGLWSLSIFGFIFVAVPILDFVIGVDVSNQTRDAQRDLNGAQRFKIQTLAVVPCVAAVIAAGASLFCSAYNAGTATTLELTGLALSVGVYTGAIGITTGHELCHKAPAIERMCGRLLLIAVSYGHFYVEHTLGHHKDVATDRDPATARYGESFWSFLPRVVYGEFCSAVRIEGARLRRKGLPFFCNEIFLYYVASAAMGFVLASCFGRPAVAFFALQSLMAILLFEAVNYLEHYGLERRIVSKTEVKKANSDDTSDNHHNDGVVYEQVQPQHSWDSPCRLTNMILIKLQRHADHHANAGKRYQTLQSYENCPQLPSGYATCILLSFFPPLWRAVMHPRLMAFRKTQTGQVWRHGPTPKGSD